MTTKTTTNRNCPIPKEGGSRPAGDGVFEEVVIRVASPPGQNFSIFIVHCQESGGCTILNTSESLSRQTSRRISRPPVSGEFTIVRFSDIDRPLRGVGDLEAPQKPSPRQ
jgi:hypothetical protein